MEETIKNILESYNFEIARIAKEIKKRRAKIVLLQFPNGLKPTATKIAEQIEKLTNTECLIWLGSCFGACDLPPVKDLEALGIEMIIQFGHAPWPYKRKDIKIIK